ncbi:thioredoxin family protein [Salegentibacter sp. JZCK2]|uniref:thioredoxin family protein n=1 Tax=Salegentibacter tibetensis TaxID=2873600 RepID=UPI001CC93528|nr:thioredoxin family protein [Salegentibacter tibetensis]MBZ9731576.1 thioredoxin family protein [Salegentibacter tibetensis]
MKHLFILFFICSQYSAFAQGNQSVKWISFEQLEDSLAEKPKKVLIYFNADWCVYCKKMEQVAFKKIPVIKKLNEEFYTVKLDAESKRNIRFDGRDFTNEQAKTQRNGIHQIALLLASRKNTKFSLPAIVVLDESFRVKQRSFEYLTEQDLLKMLR